MILNGHLYLGRTYLRNWSLVVPVCIKELAMTVAVWQTEFRTASCHVSKITELRH